MDAHVGLGLLLGLVIGLVIGGLAVQSRASARVAAARAEIDAGASNHELLVRSLASASEDAARRQSGAIGSQVSHIVEPLLTTLDQLANEVRRTEHNRIGAYAGLSQQVGEMRMATTQLGSQTHRLTNALHAPQLRGRWGELHLRRVVELAGLSEHCDFDEQVNGAGSDEAGVRPDLVVRLPDDGTVVVDAKVPLAAYLDAVATDDPGIERQELGRHARAMRAHVSALAHKKYWSAVSTRTGVSPDLVVMFVPADPILEAACRHDPDLLEFGFARNVVIATPSSLVALLRTVALGWRHDALSRDAAHILGLGRELHHRINTVGGHLNRLGSSLDKAVESFNSAVGTIDSRVTVTARKLGELEALGLINEDEGSRLQTVERRTRTVVTNGETGVAPPTARD
ncbi:DNA recombination protein RmuC [Williamsia sterculiae]|nr:DNA recombination protein RmuC [Williamsia sterculiae]